MIYSDRENHVWWHGKTERERESFFDELDEKLTMEGPKEFLSRLHQHFLSGRPFGAAQLSSLRKMADRWGM